MHNPEMTEVMSMFHSEEIGGFTFGIAEPHELHEVRRVHHDRYLAEGYITEPSPTGLIDDEFVDLSLYFFCRDINGQVVGVVRQVNGSPAGLPALNDFDIYPSCREQISSIPWPKIVEIGALAAIPGHNVAEGLYRQIWRHSKVVGHTHWVAAIDSRLLRSFKRMRGFIWEQIGDEKHYKGSATTPVFANLAAQTQNMQRLAPRFMEYLDGNKPNHLYMSR